MMKKSWKALALGAVVFIAVVFIAITTGTFVPLALRSSRSVRPLPVPQPVVLPAFDPEQSAALFVGVRKFTHHQIVDIPYAVDDAVDLAYVFALDRRVHLVPANRVVLALSGRPFKKESQQRLIELQAAGARVEPAHPSDILALLHRQAALAGKAGILIVSLATHGFARDGVGYILGASSLVGYPETNVSMAKLLDIIGTSDARRSLVFIDACRERLSRETRATSGDPMKAPSALFRRMARVSGQAIFYAAAAGQYAYDGDGNGVFTKAVLDGLRCNATAPRGIVTAETLSSYVDRSVRDWIRKNRDPSTGAATQWAFDGEAKNMPLALCWQPSGPTPGAANDLRVSTAGSSLTALTAGGTRLWQRDLGREITDHKVDDLDADGQKEVVAATDRSIVTFDHEGKVLWSAHEENMTLRAFVPGDLFRTHHREIVTLWGADDPSTRISVYAPDGQRLSTSDYAGRLDRVVIGRQTSRHAPKIVATGTDPSGAAVVTLFKPRKSPTGRPVWSGRLSPNGERITRLEIVNDPRDGRSDISIETESGSTLLLDFAGRTLRTKAAQSDPGVRFRLVKRTARNKAATGSE